MAQSPRRMLRKMDRGRKILRLPSAGADLGTLRKESVSFARPPPNPSRLTSSPLIFVRSPSQQGWQETFRRRARPSAANWNAGNLNLAASALSLRHLCRRRRVFQRRPVDNLCLLPRRDSMAEQAGWQRELQLSYPPLLARCRAGPRRQTDRFPAP